MTKILAVRTARLLLALCVLACGASLAASPAQADPGSLTYTPQNPIVGEGVTFTDSTTRCGNDRTWTYTVDGVARAPQANRQLVVTFSTPGSHTVSVSTYASDCDTATDSVDVLVNEAFSTSLTSSPAQPAPGQAVTLTSSTSGGYPDYHFAWSTDAGGRIDDVDEFTTQAAFDTAGPHVVRVRVTDDVGHTTTAQRTIDVVAPTTPTTPTTTTPPSTSTTPAPTTTTTPPTSTTTPVPTTATQPPIGTLPVPTTTTTPTATTPAGPAVTPETPAAAVPTCPQRLSFALTEVTTTGCFQQATTSPSATWTTTSSVKVNGIPFRGTGQTFTVTFPTDAEPGGHFSAPNSAIKLGTFTAFSGNVDWKLPLGGRGERGTVRTFPVLAGTKLFGFYVRGTIGLELGLDQDGTHFASFPLTIELPVSFNAGPDASMGRATGSASLRVDEAGIHYDGLKLEAQHVWLGKVEVDSACFSFIPANGQSLAPCAPPKLGSATTALGCSSDITTDRWDGSATVNLPGGVSLGAFGGLANGQVSTLGGSVSGLGRKVPLATNVYLDEVGFGLCLRPPPFKLQGTVGVNVFPPLATVSGTFLYTDANGLEPWSIALGGAVEVRGTSIGSGTLTYRGNGGIDFSLMAGVDFSGIASLNGSINGWVEPAQGAFTVTGAINGCVGALCAGGSATVSDTGLAGCLSYQDTSTDYGSILIDLNTGAVRFATSTINITGGVGYRWGASAPAVFVGSCDFAPYQSTRATPRAAGEAGASGLTQTIAKGTPAVALGIVGTDGPPKVVLHGPGGQTITSPAGATSASQRGRFVLVENPKADTTSVLLLHPSAGTWTVSAAPGATSTPTRVDRAAYQAPPTLAGRVRGTGAKRTIDVAYAVPAGATVRLVERKRGVAHTIAARVRGHRCSSGPRTRPMSDQPVLCATIPFRPARGPGGQRRIQAVVSRGAMPLAQQDIATFRVAAQRLPGRPGPLKARRSGRSLVVTLPRSTGASRFSVSAALADGRKLGYDLPTRCRSLRIAAVPKSVAATVTMAGVRYDLAVGPTRSLVVAANASVKPARKVKPGQRPRDSATACS